MTDSPLPTFEDLVQQAFDQARAAGKPDWEQMSVAVLKNRILGLTHGAFQEADYGAERFTGLLTRLSDPFAVDYTRTPPFVVLQSEPSMAPPAEQERIRADLWRAVMDYSSGERYGWEDAAVVTLDGDSSLVPILPTLTSEILADWRLAFADEVTSGLNDAEAARVTGWTDSTGRTALLPGRLRPAWNAYLKEQVWQRLVDWFAHESLNMPTITAPAIDRRGPTYKDADLRQFLIRALTQMSADELMQVQLPATAMSRLFGP